MSLDVDVTKNSVFDAVRFDASEQPNEALLIVVPRGGHGPERKRQASRLSLDHSQRQSV